MEESVNSTAERYGSATVTDIYIKFNRRKIDEANRRVIDLLK